MILLLFLVVRVSCNESEYFNESPIPWAHHEEQEIQTEFEITPKYAPFLMRIEHGPYKYFRTRCAGALIEKRFVLTSGTCGIQKGYSGGDLTAHHLVPTDGSISSLVLRGFYYNEFWEKNYPDIVVLELSTEIKLEENKRLLLRIPNPLPHEVKSHYKKCVIYGFILDPRSSDYPKMIAYYAWVLWNSRCQKMYAAFGDTSEKKQSFDEMFCLIVPYIPNFIESHFFSMGGPILCDDQFMGVLIYFDRFRRPKFRLFVAHRIDRFHANIRTAINKERTSSPEVPITFPEVSTDLLGQPVDTEWIEIAKKVKKTIILILLFLVCGLVIVTLAYCCWMFLRCKCPKGETEAELLRKYYEAHGGERDSLEHEFIKPSPPLVVTKPEQVKWFNPNSMFKDIVMPFFVVIMGMILTRLIHRNFAPGFRPK